MCHCKEKKNRYIPLPIFNSDDVVMLRGNWRGVTDPSRHSGGSGRRDTSSERMMLGLSGVRTVWHVVRTDGTVTDGRPDRMARSSGRLTGN
jgi:hypothetical protein